MRYGKLAVLLLAACGSKSGNSIDAAIVAVIDAPAVPADAMLDAAPTPPGCDFGEQNDQGNDDLDTGTPEATGLTFTTATTICGNIDRGHFNPTTLSVDVDTYAFTVATDGDVVVSVAGTDLGSLGATDVALLDDQGNTLGLGTFLGDHGVLSAHVPAGSYAVSVEASNPADVSVPVPYKIKIITDVAATRCPHVTAATAAGKYAEALDTAGNNQAGNDVVLVNFVADPHTALTASTTDAPEPTNLTIAPAMNYLLTGTAKLPTGASPDEYLERDAFLVRTGAATNQLAIRLNWAGQSDFDYLVFPESPVAPDGPIEIASSTQTQAGEDEFATFAVLPSHNYWVWIAPYNTDATSAPLLPSAYEASICGETFTP